jgi:hypothetical protein
MATFRQDLGTEWTPLAVGADIASVSVQIDAKTAAIFVGDETPGEDEQNYVVITRGGDPSVSVDLKETQTMWARSTGGPSATVRGITTDRD